MIVAEPKYRRPLNSEQLAVLDCLYKVRFSSSQQIAKYLLKPNQKTIQNKLQILEERGFIGKHYDKSYKLAGRAAEYFLTPRRTSPRSSLARHNQPVGDQNPLQEQDCIARVRHALPQRGRGCSYAQSHIWRHAPSFTSSQLAPYKYFPAWKPDLFLSFKGKKIASGGTWQPTTLLP